LIRRHVSGGADFATCPSENRKLQLGALSSDPPFEHVAL
jgi:hypothetical protein